MILLFYLKTFIVFSFLGFFWESFVYKFCNSNKHSGILSGPYTLVYGIGFCLILFVFNALNLPLNFLNIFLYYLLFCICATLCEFIIGFLIKFIFKKNMWDYSNHKYHFTKYICLDYFFLWGLLASAIVFLTYDFWFVVISIIPSLFVFIILIIIVIDLIVTYLKSRN